MSAKIEASASSKSRWCPTPEQLMLLEGMYRGGLKTPTTKQIQQITARLSLYGKIQGKNVFYWFQNHKARDRQRVQRKLLAMYQHQRLYHPYNLLYHHPLPLQGDASVIEYYGSSYRNIINDWNLDQNSMTQADDGSLMTVTMTESTSPYCVRVQPKTLQLFPTTPTTKPN